MSLYDEIMGLEYRQQPGCHIVGFITARRRAAELAKKYDDDIAKLNIRVAQLTAELVMNKD